MKDPLRHHLGHRELHGAFGTDAYGRFAERVARSMGTWQFLIGQSAFLVVWLLYNGVVGFLLAAGTKAIGGEPWDAAPFLLLNIMLSFQAAYAAPLILVAENRQAERDKAKEIADAEHRDELAREHSAMLAQIKDAMDCDTAGGLQRVIHRLDELEVDLLHNGHHAGPQREPPASS